MIETGEIWRNGFAPDNALATNGAYDVDEMAEPASPQGLFAIEEPDRSQVIALTAVIWTAYVAAVAANDALGSTLTMATLCRTAAFAFAGLTGGAICWGLEASFVRLKALPWRYGIATVFLTSCAAAILWTACTRLAIYPLFGAAFRLISPEGTAIPSWPYQNTMSMAFVFLAWSAGWLTLAYAGRLHASRAEAAAAQARADELASAANERTATDTLAGIWVPKRNGAARLPVEDIVSLTAERDYVRIRAGDGTEHLIRATLQNLIARLDPQSFVQVHRSVVVNTNHVRHVHRRPPRGWTIELTSGPQVPVGRSYGDTLRKLTGKN